MIDRTWACGALLPFIGFSQAAAEALEQAPIVVTATRTAQTIDETLASVTVIDRQTIRNSQARDAAELLQLYAGVDIARNGGPGQTTSLFLRGTESNQTLVLVDGVKLNPGTIGLPALQNIDPAVIERIEVVRGPRSTLYGSEAIGGVVQIFTRRGEEQGTGSLSGTLGADDARGLSAALHSPAGALQGGVDVSYEETDGFPTRTGAKEDRGFENLNLSAYADADLALGRLSLSHWQAQGNTEYFDFLDNPVDQDFTNQTSSLVWDVSVTDWMTAKLALGYGHDEIEQQQSPDFVKTDRLSLELQTDAQLGQAHLLSSGLVYTDEDTDAKSFGLAYDENRDIHALFVQDQMQFGRHRLLLGGRYTVYDAFNNQSTWELAYGYQWSARTRLFVSAATAFRVPDSTDRFGFGGNPDLRPEESFNRELGLQHQLDPGQSFQLSAFYNEIDDLIEFDNVSFQAFNTDRARIRGLELVYSLRRGALSLDSTLILQDPENRDTKDTLSRRAKKSLALNLAYDFGRVQLGANLYATGPRDDSPFSDAENPGYGLVHLTAAAELTRELTLRARLENALDQDYVLADGFNTQDRAWFLTLAYQGRGS